MGRKDRGLWTMNDSPLTTADSCSVSRHAHSDKTGFWRCPVSFYSFHPRRPPVGKTITGKSVNTLCFHHLPTYLGCNCTFHLPSLISSILIVLCPPFARLQSSNQGQISRHRTLEALAFHSDIDFLFCGDRHPSFSLLSICVIATCYREKTITTKNSVFFLKSSYRSSDKRHDVPNLHLSHPNLDAQRKSESEIHIHASLSSFGQTTFSVFLTELGEFILPSHPVIVVNELIDLAEQRDI